MPLGVILSITSTCLFAGLYYYATLLTPLNGQEIFGLRMLLTLPCITLYLLARKEWRHVVATWARIRASRTLLPGLVCSSALLGTQQWLFLWAPLNGRALQVALGYFLLPLCMLLVGRILYRERWTALRKAAALVAAAGVGHALYQAGGLSWEALLVCLGFPAYFVLRKALQTEHLGGLWFDMLLTLPVAAWLVLRQPATLESFAGRHALLPLALGLALISAAAFMCYIVASKLLPLGLFGMLGYVEPALMVGVAFVLGERIQARELWTYMPIWGAVGLLVLDGWRHLQRAKNTPSVACAK